MISFRVDLGEQCVHLSITVVNRDDCCQDRFKDATFLFLDENQETVTSFGGNSRRNWRHQNFLYWYVLAFHFFDTKGFSLR